jgi:hypothetical protein
MSWYRSPSGRLAHADGPGQAAAFDGRGWTEVDEAEAHAEIAQGVELAVDAGDTGDAAGTFDDDAVNRAVRDEAPTARPRRKRT